MSYTETPTQTIQRMFVTPGWIAASHDARVSDLLCANSESNLEWDQYYYEEKDGKLWDPKRSMFVEDSVKNDPVEKGVVSQLQEWFASHDSGIAVSISTKGSFRKYPNDKLAIHRIAYKMRFEKDAVVTQKVLICASHPFKSTFRNPEEIREFIFPEEDKEESALEIISWLKRISEKKVETEVRGYDEKTKMAEFYVYQYEIGVPHHQIVYQMQQTQFLGKNSFGCGPGTETVAGGDSYFSTMTQIPEGKTMEWKPGTCKNCGAHTMVGPCSICKPCESRL